MERLKLPATLPSLAAFRDFVSQAAFAAGVGPQLLLKIEIVLEELLVNHVMHAYGSGEGDSEVVCFRKEPAMFCVQVIDHGPPFDPLQRPTPDLELAPESRPVGGLGIYLVKSMSSEVTYERDADRNVLTACFAVTPETELKSQAD